VAARIEADVYQCLDPWTLRIGLSLKHERPATRLVYEASEWFPRAFRQRTDLFLPVRLFGSAYISHLESRACHGADAIIDTNATRAARFGGASVPTVLVPNYPPLDLLPEPPVERKPWVAWTGLASRPRGFDRLLEALAPLCREFADLRLRVVGQFDPRDDIENWTREFIGRQGMGDRIDLLGPLPYRQMFEAIRPCLAGGILFQPGRINDYTGQPNKLFEFMGAGLALVASNFPEIAPAVLQADCGWLVDPRSVEAIRAAIRSAITDPVATANKGAAGRRAVLERFHWGIAEQALLGLYKVLLK
jgi:glycosyltransferase involved in cell wall biosynthesis